MTLAAKPTKAEQLKGFEYLVEKMPDAEFVEWAKKRVSNTMTRSQLERFHKLTDNEYRDGDHGAFDENALQL